MGIAIITLFILGYLFITLEHSISINKAAIALLTGVLCWTIYILFSTDSHLINEQLTEHLGEISGILFFLMGAMTIVELIDAHDGFEVITNAITTLSKRKLLWIICFLAFFLSAVLDNLTTTIVLVSLLRKLIDSKNDRMLFIGMVVISANAGGAWSPIGDVTTTMLWIGGQVTTKNIILNLFIPSLVCLVVPLLAISFNMKGSIKRPVLSGDDHKSIASRFERNTIFFSGLGILLFVPVFKTITHLPPFMGMLFGLGILWIISELIHKDKDESDKNTYSVLHALRKIDMPSVLFFLGILISISALQSTGQLEQLATLMDEKIGNINIVVMSVGLLSAIVDNVPLVAASMGMHDLQTYPTDHYFWEFLAYCAGTGGSALIIGSAAGVAAMGMEKIDFFWYMKKISWLALLGYFAGAFTYILQHHIFS
ncbi:MAG: sodium:proton antiporter NhaD [Bacteroidetes bacterium]|nr:sodium:proton antiporter NhaD [Bacteroidota bacterium]